MSDSVRVKSPVSPGDVVAGKYRVERMLGSGGMGVVVAARHIDLDQPVALKFILPHALAGKGNVERFMREARSAVRLKSEHIARVYDVGRDAEDRPFMVLELLEGMDLAKLTAQLRAKNSALPVMDAVEYVLQACEALVEAHAAGIVHRDLKPQNLYVTRRLNGTPLLKVLDFGIAKAIGPAASGQMALTDSAAIIGSPLYMAPEQMRSARSADVRSDIWALGVILYELLGGHLPFDGETVTEVCIRVVNESPAPLVDRRPGLEPGLVAIVMRCLAKEPEARYHNVSALAAALEPFSRSAKQGGPVRPWRSFEDTQDSQGGGNPFAAGLALADATGPSTAVTMDSLPPLDDGAENERSQRAVSSGGSGAPIASTDERRARALAGSTKASAGSRRSNPAEAGRPLVSTDVTWGETSDPPGSGRARRSFSTGMVAAIVVTVAAAAVVVGLVVGRGTSFGSSGGAVATASAGPNAASTAGVAAGSPASHAPASPGSPAPAGDLAADVPAKGAHRSNPGEPSGKAAEPATAAPENAPGSAPAAGAGAATTSPRSVTPATPASVTAVRLISAGKTTRAAREAAAAAAASTTTAAPARPPEPKAAAPREQPPDPVSPNGAPILR